MSNSTSHRSAAAVIIVAYVIAYVTYFYIGHRFGLWGWYNGQNKGVWVDTPWGSVGFEFWGNPGFFSGNF